MKVFLDTWVLVERYKGNQDAVKVLRAARKGLEAHISHITIAELVNVISREYGEREARVQYPYLRRLPLTKSGTTEEISKNARLFKTKYRFSVADAMILSTPLQVNALLLITGTDKQYNEKWGNVSELEVRTLSEYSKTLDRWRREH